jgi:regulator of cell morphogenesis and NO signaling
MTIPQLAPEEIRMVINPNATSIAELVLEVPGALRVLEELKIDFCCYGPRTVADACADAGIGVDDLVEAIGGELVANAARDWRNEPVSSLQDHVVSSHHVFTRHALDTVALLAERVAGRHGVNHPEVLRVRELVTLLQQELLEHMRVEEEVVFPYLQKIEVALKEESEPAAIPPAAFDVAIRSIAEEHEAAFSRLLEIRRETGEYALPDDACLSYRALYERLSALEKDLNEHMQIENEFLYSRALFVEQNVRSAFR